MSRTKPIFKRLNNIEDSISPPSNIVQPQSNSDIPSPDVPRGQYIMWGSPSEAIKYYKFDPYEVYGSAKEQILNPDKCDNDAENAANANEIKSLKRQASEKSIKIENLDNSEPNYQINEENQYYNGYDLIKNISTFGLKEEGCLEESYENQFFAEDDLKHIEVIRLRAYYQYYHKIDNLYKDIMALLKYTISKRCKNVLAKYYVTEILYKVQSLFQDKDRIAEFKKFHKKDFAMRFDNNCYLKVQGKWCKKPGPKRKYIPIDDYAPIIDDNDTVNRMRTTKTAH